MSLASVIYCVDTSFLVDAHNRRLPPKLFPTFWERIDELVDDARIVSPRIVLTELQEIDDQLYSWAKERRRIFKEPAYYINAEVTVIANRFPRLYLRGTNKNQADPFVVAMAKYHGYTVVAEERGGSEDDPKIPYMCREFGVAYRNLFGLMEDEKWRI